MTLTYIAERFGSGAVTTCFYDLGLSLLEFEYQTFRLRGERSNPLLHRCGCCFFFLMKYIVARIHLFVLFIEYFTHVPYDVKITDNEIQTYEPR